jgi:2-C-methyl-D-erythritol 4-phosphate cytidylyltransferase
MAHTSEISALQPLASAVLLATGLPGNADAGSLLWSSVAGQPVLAWSIAAYATTTQIRALALVVLPARLAQARALIAALPWGNISVVAAPTGRERDAILSGLAALPADDIDGPDDALIVIHSCNYPLVTPEVIAEGIALAAQFLGDGAVACEPVKETIKRVTDGVVVATPPRAQLALLQSPQVFPSAALLAASQRQDSTSDTLDPADTASLLLASGMRIHTFPGGHAQLCVSRPVDLAVAERYLLRAQQ